MQKVEALSEVEYLKLFDLIKQCLDVCRRRYNWCSSNKQLYMYTLQSAQRHLSWGYNRDAKLYKMVRDAKRSYNNPTLVNLHGVKVVNDMLNIIDNMSSESLSDADSLLELKDALSGMRNLNLKAKEVSDKCEVVSGKLDKICEYVEGNADEF